MVPVDFRGRGGFQDDRIGHDGRQEHAGERGRDIHAVLAELHGNERGRGADGAIEELDGVGRGHIGDAVMVDDLQDVRFLYARCGLAHLVVVHQDHVPTRRRGHIGARDDADGATRPVQHHCFAQLARDHVIHNIMQDVLGFEPHHVLEHQLAHLLGERFDQR